MNQMKKIKVLHVTGKMDVGGAEVMLMDLMRSKSEVFQFDFLINVRNTEENNKGFFDIEILKLGGQLSYIGSQSNIGILNYIKKFKKIIEESGKPDIVHIHLNAKCGVISLAAKLCGIKKIISHSHAALNFDWSSFRGIAQNIELLLQKPLIFFCSSEYWGCSQEANNSLYYSKFINKNNSKVINNAINYQSFCDVSNNDIKEFKQHYDLEANSLLIGSLGRIVWNKKLDFIFEILNTLHQKKVAFLFVFAGRKDDEKLFNSCINLARNNGFEHKVLYLGECSQVPTFLSSMDVFLAPSLNEGFGMVALEAQAAGIKSKISHGFPELVDLNVGLVDRINSWDAKVWADSICEETIKVATREQISKAIDEKGFDVKTNTQLIQKYYLQ
jgi:glycosyltransferase EpsF